MKVVNFTNFEQYNFTTIILNTILEDTTIELTQKWIIVNLFFP